MDGAQYRSMADLRSIPASPQGSRQAPPRKRPGDLAWRIGAILVVALLGAVLLWSMGAEKRAIARMDPAERRAVYENAYGELKRLCGSGPRDDALEDRCRAQIQFVLKFPECDAACQEIARAHTPAPRK